MIALSSNLFPYHYEPTAKVDTGMPHSSRQEKVEELKIGGKDGSAGIISTWEHSAE